MDLLIKSAKVIDPNSEFNGSTVDIRIRNGKIEEIDTELQPQDCEIFERDNLHVSPGWFDMHVNFCEPGLEHKENIESGLSAAASGGFTGVGILPSTSPPIHKKGDVQFILSAADQNIVDVFPIGTISENRLGENIAELYDMHCAGAVAFSDDQKDIANPSLMSRALLYAKNFNGLVMSFPFDSSLCDKGQMNEGTMSTHLGMKGIPNISEEIRVARDIALVKYNDAQLHFNTVSTSQGLEQIREAKIDNVSISCDVAAHQLAFTEDNLETFDTNLKVLPPFRTENDRLELLRGLEDGTIDVICSDHRPEDGENKIVEFEHARFGIIGLETCFANANTALKNALSIEEIVVKMAINPRTIYKLDLPMIKEGFLANLTFFDPDKEWEFQETNIKSNSKNTPFIGTKFTGKALGIYNKKELKTNP